jgi:hypothetical protein
LIACRPSPIVKEMARRTNTTKQIQIFVVDVRLFAR